MKDIIIFGLMGAGKTTIAKIIGEKYGHSRKSLGSKIHSECKLHGGEKREEMQKYGQSMREIFGINIWCDYLWDSTKEGEKIVIDDARQLNEFDYFSGRRFITIGVISNEVTRLERLQKRVTYTIDPETFKHSTETQARLCVDKCEIVLSNDAGLEELEKQIEDKLGEVLRRG
jgi:dephospho-CoA kinase